MSTHIINEHSKQFAVLNEKADQLAEDADRVHDDVRILEAQVKQCNKQIVALTQITATLDARIAAASDIGNEADRIAAKAAEQAKHEAYEATYRVLDEMTKRISSATAAVEKASEQAVSRLRWSKAWALSFALCAIGGISAGVYGASYFNSRPVVTQEQIDLMNRGQQLDAILRRATRQERDLMQKILNRPIPAK